MTTVFPTQDVFASGAAISETTTPYAISNGDALIIGQDYTIGSASQSAILFSGELLDLRIEGSVFGVNDTVRMDSDSSTTPFNYSISVSETGRVYGRDFTFYVGSNSQTTIVDGSSIVMANDGEVVSTDRGAVFLFYADAALVQNTGIIRSLDGDDDYSHGVTFFGINEATAINSGLIETAGGTNGGGDDHRSIAAISYESGTEAAVLNNSGTISAPHVALYSDATVSESFTNSGTMIGDLRLSRTVGGELENTGTIEGRVFTYGGDDFVFNSGFIQGDVNLGGGDDIYRAFDDGALSGTVLGGSGNDTINGGSLADALRGEGGDDAIRGRNGDDDLWGDDGNDLLAGGGGDDELRGGAGNDRLRGGEGNDDVLGGSGDDVLGGGAGDDVIQGASGEDSLRGSDGRDILIGGRDADVLVGGADGDTFVWNDENDAGSSRAASDVVRDFESGVDVMDLSGLGDLDFVSSGFSGSGNGEVRVVTTSAGDSLVRIDLDGDGERDMQIVVEGVTGLGASDFLL